MNSYVSAITELYAWQLEGKASLPLRGAKLSAVLESVRRDEDRIRRVNFIDQGLFTITGGYDVKGLKRQSLGAGRRALKCRVQLSLTFELQLSIY